MKKLLIALTGPMLLLAAIPAHATTQTWTYVAATVVSCGGGICSPQVGSTRVAPLGAFLVTPTVTTISVKVVDAAGPKNEFDLCQENASGGTDLANFCGDGPDDVQVGPLCATGATQTAGTTWKVGNPVLVSLFAASITCDGIGTTGTATVTF